jgi:signal transduction histidine kinase
MSQHHFKNGLWTISGWLETVKKGDATADEALEKIETMVKQLGPIAQRNKNLVKPIVIQAVRTEELWDGLRKEVTIAASVAGVSVEAAPVGLPELLADKDFLREIFFTLVDNSIRYAGRGAKIKIDANHSGLMVTDDGKGLSREIKINLFVPGNSTEALSTGQGLYVAKLMAQEIGGDLVHLETARGAAFEIRLKRSQQ